MLCRVMIVVWGIAALCLPAAAGQPGTVPRKARPAATYHGPNMGKVGGPAPHTGHIGGPAPHA